MKRKNFPTFTRKLDTFYNSNKVCVNRNARELMEIELQHLRTDKLINEHNAVVCYFQYSSLYWLLFAEVGVGITI